MQVRVGDLLRGTTFVTMGMSYPTWQVPAFLHAATSFRHHTMRTKRCASREKSFKARWTLLLLLFCHFHFISSALLSVLSLHSRCRASTLQNATTACTVIRLALSLGCDPCRAGHRRRHRPAAAAEAADAHRGAELRAGDVPDFFESLMYR